MARMGLPVSVTVALTSADELRFMLERMDVSDVEDRSWLGWQADLLHHWAGIAAEEAPFLPALTAGLDEFAIKVASRAGVPQSPQHS